MNLTLKVLIATLLLSGNSVVLAVSAGANLLGNSDFDNGLLVWTIDDDAAVTWVANYDAPPPGSSSLGAVGIYSDSRLPKGLSQCVPVYFGLQYKVAAWAIATCSGNARIEVSWNGRPDCDSTSALGIVDQISSTQTSNDWQLLQSTLVAPDTALGAVVAFQNTNACNEAVFFDNTFFGDRIFISSFE